MNNVDRLAAIGIGSVLCTLVIAILSHVGDSNGDPMGKIGSYLGPELLSMSNANLTDDQLILKTRDLPEVKYLISNYPDASENVSVFRRYTSSPIKDILVTYSVEKNVIDSSGYSNWRKLNLVVSFDQTSNKTSHVGVGCELSDASILQTMSDVAMENLQRNVCFS